MDPVGCEFVGDDVGSQTKQVMDNLSAIIEAADLTLNDVAKCTCYLKSMQDFVEFN